MVGIDCGFAVAHPWLCDAMGHLSTRHYMAMFDDASYQLFTTLGYDAVTAAADGWGWADVRHEINYTREVKAGAVLRVTGRITALGHSSISAVFALVDRSGEHLCAEMTARTVCFDIGARKSRPLPPPIATKARVLFGVEQISGGRAL